MNMLANLAVPQLDEVGLYAPISVMAPLVTQAVIDAGVRRAHRLRAEAFLGVLRRLLAMLR